jgi:hypothetical protein
MSTKKELVIEKGIEHSVSPKRDVLVVPPGARGAESIHPAHLAQPEVTQDDDRGPMALDITGLVLRKQLKKKEEKRLKKLKERGDLAGKAKMPGSPLSPSSSSSISSVSTVSLSPTEIFAYEEEQRLKANLTPLGSPKSVSPRLSPLGRGTGTGMGVGARARRKSSSSTSSSSSSKSPKRRKPLTPRFEKVEATSVSPKGRGKGKEGTKHEGGAGRTRRKYKCKLRKTHSRKRR